MQRLPEEMIEPFLTDLKTCAPDTTCSVTSEKPLWIRITNDKHVIIAKMDSFGLDRFFTVTSQEDIDNLSKAIVNGGGTSVSWYTLPSSLADNLVIITTQ